MEVDCNHIRLLFYQYKIFFPLSCGLTLLDVIHDDTRYNDTVFLHVIVQAFYILMILHKLGYILNKSSTTILNSLIGNGNDPNQKGFYIYLQDLSTCKKTFTTKDKQKDFDSLVDAILEQIKDQRVERLFMIQYIIEHFIPQVRSSSQEGDILKQSIQMIEQERSTSLFPPPSSVQPPPKELIQQPSVQPQSQPPPRELVQPPPRELIQQPSPLLLEYLDVPPSLEDDPIILDIESRIQEAKQLVEQSLPVDSIYDTLMNKYGKQQILYNKIQKEWEGVKVLQDQMIVELSYIENQLEIASWKTSADLGLIWDELDRRYGSNPTLMQKIKREWVKVVNRVHHRNDIILPSIQQAIQEVEQFKDPRPILDHLDTLFSSQDPKLYEYLTKKIVKVMDYEVSVKKSLEHIEQATIRALEAVGDGKDYHPIFEPIRLQYKDAIFLQQVIDNKERMIRDNLQEIEEKRLRSILERDRLRKEEEEKFKQQQEHIQRLRMVEEERLRLEEKVRIEQEKERILNLERQDKERKQKLELERIHKEEQEQLALERQRLEQLERQRLDQEEHDRIALERKKLEERRIEQKRIQKQEQDRIKKERMEQLRVEQERRKRVQEEERVERERLRVEREQQQKLEMEKHAREHEDRLLQQALLQENENKRLNEERERQREEMEQQRLVEMEMDRKRREEIEAEELRVQQAHDLLQKEKEQLHHTRIINEELEYQEKKEGDEKERQMNKEQVVLQKMVEDRLRVLDRWEDYNVLLGDIQEYLSNKVSIPSPYYEQVYFQIVQQRDRDRELINDLESISIQQINKTLYNKPEYLRRLYLDKKVEYNKLRKEQEERERLELEQKRREQEQLDLEQKRREQEEQERLKREQDRLNEERERELEQDRMDRENTRLMIEEENRRKEMVIESTKFEEKKRKQEREQLRDELKRLQALEKVDVFQAVDGALELYKKGKDRSVIAYIYSLYKKLEDMLRDQEKVCTSSSYKNQYEDRYKNILSRMNDLNIDHKPSISQSIQKEQLLNNCMEIITILRKKEPVKDYSFFVKYRSELEKVIEFQKFNRLIQDLYTNFQPTKLPTQEEWMIFRELFGSILSDNDRASETVSDVYLESIRSQITKIHRLGMKLDDFIPFLVDQFRRVIQMGTQSLDPTQDEIRNLRSLFQEYVDAYLHDPERASSEFMKYIQSTSFSPRIKSEMEVIVDHMYELVHEDFIVQ